MSGRRMGAYLATMGMDVSCLYVLLSLAYGNIPPVAVILAAYPLSFFINLVASDPMRGSARGAALSAVAGAGAVVVVLTLEWLRLLSSSSTLDAGAIVGLGFQAVFCGLVWWLGYRLAGSKMDNSEVINHLQLGVAGLLVLTMFGASTFLAVVLFFASALTALAVSRWETTVTRTTAVLKDFRAWATALACAGTVLVGALVSLLLSPDLAREMMDRLRAVAMSLAGLIGLDEVPRADSKPMTFDIACNFKPSGESRIDVSPPPADGGAGAVSPVVLWVLLAAVLLAVSVAMVLLARRVRRRGDRPRRRTTTVVSERTRRHPLRSASAVLVVLSSAWRRLVALVRSIAGWRRSRAEGEATSVRAVYRLLLEWGARRGRPRQAWLTPVEYAKVLGDYLPESGADLSEITEAYTEARYGRRPEGKGGLEVARKAWLRIRARRS